MSGYIYLFVHCKDDKDTYYNIGATKRSVDTRLKEKPKGTKRFFAFKVFDYKKMERAIHKALDKHRVYRYFTENEEYITLWKHNKQPVTKTDDVLSKKHRLQGIHRHIEWFRLSWKEIEAVVVPMIRNEQLPEERNCNQDDTSAADCEPHGNPREQIGAKQLHGNRVSNGDETTCE